MTIEEALYGRLSVNATLVSLEATGYPVQTFQSAPSPFWLYNEAEQATVMGLSGPVNLNRFGLHIDCYATDYATAKALRQAIKADLNGFSGLIGSGAFAVRGAFHEAGDDGAEVPIHADEMGLFRAGLDVTIHYGDA